MGAALGDKLASRKIKDAHNAERPAHGEVLVAVAYAHGLKLISFILEGTAVKDELCICLAQVPVRDLAFLAYGDELVVVGGSNAERVDATHALCLG